MGKIEKLSKIHTIIKLQNIIGTQENRKKIENANFTFF